MSGMPRPSKLIRVEIPHEDNFADSLNNTEDWHAQLELPCLRHLPRGAVNAGQTRTAVSQMDEV